MHHHEASRGAQSVPVKVAGCGFELHSRKLNIYLHLYLFSFLNLINTQYLQNTAESGERIGSLCLSCCRIQREADLIFFKNEHSSNTAI